MRAALGSKTGLPLIEVFREEAFLPSLIREHLLYSLTASSFVDYLVSQSCSLFAIQELEELLTEIKDISVVLGIDNTCKLNLSRIVEEVRAQYEALALRSWEEAETLTRRKVFVSLSD